MRKNCLGGFWRLRSCCLSSLPGPRGRSQRICTACWALCCYTAFPNHQALQHSQPNFPSYRLLSLLLVAVVLSREDHESVHRDSLLHFPKRWSISNNLDSNKTCNAVLKCHVKCKSPLRLRSIKNTCRPWVLSSPAVSNLHHFMRRLSW